MNALGSARIDVAIDALVHVTSADVPADAVVSELAVPVVPNARQSGQEGFMYRRAVFRGLFVLGSATIALQACNAAEIRECTMADCSDGATVTAHVQALPTALLQATTTLCWNDRCSTVTPRVLDGGIDPGLPRERDDGLFVLSGPIEGHGRVEDEGLGWARLELRTSTSGESGPLDDGDRWRMTIRSPDGTTLLDVERHISYGLDRPNGPECGPACKFAALELYADSESGLSCTGNRCSLKPEVSFHKVLTGRAMRPFGANIVVCVNEQCSAPATFQRMSRDAGRAMFGGRASGMAWFEDGDGGQTELTVTLEAPSAALDDGDHYRIAILPPHDEAEPISVFDGIVTYETEFPNGPACDRHPCRRLRMEIP